MITLHFHLQPQYKYESFHIYFTSFHCTGRYELNKLTSLPMCGFIAQLVEHRTGIAEVTGSNPVEALIFFRLLLSNCLNLEKFTAMITLHFHFVVLLRCTADPQNTVSGLKNVFPRCRYKHIVEMECFVMLSCIQAVENRDQQPNQ